MSKETATFGKSSITRKVIDKYKEEENVPKKETETNISERRTKIRRFGVGAKDENAEENIISRNKIRQKQIEVDRGLGKNRSDFGFRNKYNLVNQENVNQRSFAYPNNYDFDDTNDNKEESLKDSRFSYKKKTDLEFSTKQKNKTFVNKTDIRKWGEKKQSDDPHRQPLHIFNRY